MSKIGVGKEVLSYCGKCKLVLAHLVTSMKDDKNIGKVECKTCKANHAYKDPSKVKPGRKKRATTAKKSTKIERPISDLWMEAINKSTKKSKDYSVKGNFVIGDIIDHPTFGPGVVDRTIDKDKIQVIFRHDIKTLIHNKN